MKKPKPKPRSAIGSPMSPMLVQYLVGLCCLRTHPDAVEIVIGDMVADSAAGKPRDVDVTVTMRALDGSVSAFKGYEVKHEAKPLDVAVVEQLCTKLLDMDSVTQRSIVSTSSYTDGARSKAERHGVALYDLIPWTRPLQEQFPALAMEGTADECFPMRQTLLFWVDYRLNLVARSAKGPFNVGDHQVLLCNRGEPHPTHKTLAGYRDHLLYRSTSTLFDLSPASDILRTFPIPYETSDGSAPGGPAWPHTHTLDVTGDAVYVEAAGEPCRLDAVTINGQLQWQRDTRKPVYYVMQKVDDGTAFAGALTCLGAREGQMKCLVLSPDSREIGIHFVELTEKQLHAIRNLDLRDERGP